MSTTTLRELERTPDARPPRPSRWVVPGSMLGYGALGLLYGSALRLWMRVVSDDPEFTWAGTLFIVGAFTIAFAMAGLVAGGRRRGWKGLLIPARAAALVTSLGCFGGAGVLMLPTVVPGSLALARTDWRRWIRVTLVVVAFLPSLVLLGSVGDLGVARGLVGYALYLGLVAFQIRIFSEPYKPSVGRLPALVKVATVGAGVLAMLGVAAMTVGLFFTTE
jgi:hypothetical protein